VLDAHTNTDSRRPFQSRRREAVILNPQGARREIGAVLARRDAERDREIARTAAE
jgi:hypothetical protein